FVAHAQAPDRAGTKHLLGPAQVLFRLDVLVDAEQVCWAVATLVFEHDLERTADSVIEVIALQQTCRVKHSAAAALEQSLGCNQLRPGLGACLLFPEQLRERTPFFIVRRRRVGFPAVVLANYFSNVRGLTRDPLKNIDTVIAVVELLLDLEDEFFEPLSVDSVLNRIDPVLLILAHVSSNRDHNFLEHRECALELSPGLLLEP